MALLSDLQDRVVEETFMNGLLIWIKVEVDFCHPVGLTQMMRLAQLVENWKIIRNETNLKGYDGGKYPVQNSYNIKSNTTASSSDNKGNTIFPMRMITLRGTSSGETKKEGLSRRLSDAKFQARKEKGLCFRCNEKYSHDHNCHNREQREYDNKVVISITHNPVLHDRKKQIEADKHFIKEKLEAGIICIPYLPTSEQIVNVLTPN